MAYNYRYRGVSSSLRESSFFRAGRESLYVPPVVNCKFKTKHETSLEFFLFFFLFVSRKATHTAVSMMISCQRSSEGREVTVHRSLTAQSTARWHQPPPHGDVAMGCPRVLKDISGIKYRKNCVALSTRGIENGLSRPKYKITLRKISALSWGI